MNGSEFSPSSASRPSSARSHPPKTVADPPAEPSSSSPSHKHSHDHNHGHNPGHDHPDPSHGHQHDEESIRRIVNRLSRIEGHIRGIKRMVQEHENCPDVLIQIAAVRGALDKVSRLILDEHLTQCVVRAAQEGNIEAELAELKDALNRFLP